MATKIRATKIRATNKSVRRRKTPSEWQKTAEARVQIILKMARAFKALRSRNPTPHPWQVEVKFISKSAMTEMNGKYRKRRYPTDILSFSAPPLFAQQGVLGELVICLPVMKAQAKAMMHRNEEELDVLLIHGILHLLGFDHEVGPKEAAVMAQWESQLLLRLERWGGSTGRSQRRFGLIDRTNSGK